MALPKFADIKAMSDAELEAAIAATKKELFEYRLQQGTGRLEKTHVIKHAKHKLGQLLTVESQRKKPAK
jgi:large subunit ribosomal protein L29